MGQNQLLMIILSVIVVGVAVTVGISQFAENALTANRDAVASDCQRIVSSAQQWYRKPAALGGGGNAYTGLTLANVGIDSTNVNGDYTVTVDNADQITVVGTGNEKNGAGNDVQVTLVHDASTGAITYSDNM